MLSRILFIVMAVLLVSCTAEQLTNVVTDDKSSFVVNGSGYTNTKFKGYAIDTASFARLVDSNAALVVISGLTSKSTENFAITLVLKSATPGTYAVNGLEGTTMTLVTSAGSSPVTYVATSGSIAITTWGVIGGQVTGNFTGSFALASDPSHVVLEVTSGVYAVKRAS